MKADAASGRHGRGHELANGIEHDLELRIVFPLQLVHAAGQIGVGRQEAALANEGAHNLDVHLDRALAVQDTGQHGHAVLRERKGQRTASAPAGT